MENKKMSELSQKFRDGQIGLYDIAEFFIETYPEDIFVTGPYPIPEIRKLFEELLKMRK